MRISISPAYRRGTGNLPETRRINMFAEATPTREGAVLQSRPGTQTRYTVGSGPVAGLYSQKGVYGGDVFAVSASTLYRGTTALGVVSGTGPVSFAGSQTELVVCRGRSLHNYEAGVFKTVAFPDGLNVAAVAYIGSRFVAIPTPSVGRFYYTAVLNADSIGGLDFANAESAPDGLLDVARVGDEIWMLGETTIEPHYLTGDSDAPFARAAGRLYQRGVLKTGVSRALDNTLFAIGDDKIVYRFAQVPQRISDHAIEERIKLSVTHEAFDFEWEGHKFFCIRLDSETLAYDVATGEWCEFQTNGGNWNARSACSIDGQPLFGAADSGKVYEFAGWTDDGTALERLFSFAVPITGGSVRVDNLMIGANVGQTELLIGVGAEPVAELRMSRDFETFGGWRTAPLGSQGRYRTLTEWRRLGMYDAPGALGEIRTTAPVPFRVSHVTVNEPGGGRSR